MTHVNGRKVGMAWDLGEMSGSEKCRARKIIFIFWVVGDNLSYWCWLHLFYYFGSYGSKGRKKEGEGDKLSSNCSQPLKGPWANEWILWNITLLLQSKSLGFQKALLHYYGEVKVWPLLFQLAFPYWTSFSICFNYWIIYSIVCVCVI